MGLRLWRVCVRVPWPSWMRGSPQFTPVAGVAMGLVKEGEKFKILTDILGDEDHLGDMDFKVAGSKKGITAIQMDIKIAGITKEIFVQAMEQARKARFIS